MRNIRDALALLALLCCPVPATAQPAGPRPRATLVLLLDRGGNVNVVALSVPGARDAAALERAFRAAVSVPLDEVRVKPLLPGTGLHARGRTPPGRGAVTLWQGLQVDPAPLMDVLGPLGLTGIQMTLLRPPTAAEASRSLLTQLQSGRPSFTPLVTRFFTLDTTDPPLPLVPGYRLADSWRLLVPLLLLLVPIGVTLRARCRALEQARDDPYAAWFGRWRHERTIGLLTWGLWLGALALTDGAEFAHAAAGYAVSLPSLAIAACLVPPAAAIALCRWLGHPVYACVPQAGWTRRAVARRAVWWMLLLVVPTLLIGASLSTLAPKTMVAGGVAGAVAALILFANALGTRTARQVSLPDGPLRQRIFEIVEDAGQKVDRVDVLPAAQWRLINVLTFPGRNVHLSPPVVEGLTTREVDALVAHELVFLRQQGRGTWGSIVAGVALFLSLPLFIVLALLFGPGRWGPPGLFVLYALGPLLVVPQRRFAARYDAPSLATTRDPEALMTALVKLARLGLMPLSDRPDRPGPLGLPWDRLAALAHAAGLPEERLAEVIGRGSSGDHSYPPLPATLFAPHAGPDESGLVLPAGARRRFVAGLSWSLFGATVVGPLLAGLAAQALALHGAACAGLFALGVAGAVAARRLARVVVVRWFLRRARRRLRERLLREKPPAGDAGLCVGCSPGAIPRSYDGITSWDVGLLFLDGDRLVYLGDRTRFSLGRGDVARIGLGPGLLAGKRWQRVHLRWRKEDGEAVLTFEQLEQTPWLPTARPQRVFYERLRRWLEGSAGEERPAVRGEQPGPPDLPPPGGEPVAARLSVATMVIGTLVVAALVGLLCWLVGLDFVGARRDGWYVILSVVAVELAQTISARLRARGRG